MSCGGDNQIPPTNAELAASLSKVIEVMSIWAVVEDRQRIEAGEECLVEGIKQQARRICPPCTA